MPRTKREIVFFILGGFFLTNALLGELTGGKLFEVKVDWGWLKLPSVVLSIGVIPWPVVFVTTDLINEYFGREGVRKLTFLAVGMIIYSFAILFAAMQVTTWSNSPVSAEAFNTVFGQSQWIIVGSITAFLTSQFLDVFIFTRVRSFTGEKMLWLRATGSTVFSQMLDTFVVGYIAFVLPGKLVEWGLLQGGGRSFLTLEQLLPLATGNYLYKLLIAILITPVIYVVHGAIDRYLGLKLEPSSSTQADSPSIGVETDLTG